MEPFFADLGFLMVIDDMLFKLDWGDHNENCDSVALPKSSSKFSVNLVRSLGKQNFNFIYVRTLGTRLFP